ncbi:MAG: hypothetical protein K6G17_08650 [Oscillospiraceae bacterium]|nr:hypothetical protein [Oscillospiraceae bacterium]
MNDRKSITNWVCPACETLNEGGNCCRACGLSFAEAEALIRARAAEPRKNPPAPAAVPPTPAPGPSPAPKKEKKRLVPLIALAVVAVLALAGWLLWQRFGAEADEDDGGSRRSTRSVTEKAEPTPEPTVCGRWSGEIDVTDVMVANIGEEIRPYLDGPLTASIELTFSESGDYARSVDMKPAAAVLREALLAYFRDALAEAGLSEEDFSAYYGKSVEGYTDELIDEAFEETAFSDSGSYTLTDYTVAWDGDTNSYWLNDGKLTIDFGEGVGLVSFRRG